MAGGHLEMPGDLLSMEIKRQCPAAAWRRAGARAARLVHALGCVGARGGLRSRSGRPVVVELAYSRELSLLSSVITYDGLSVAREWLGLAVGPGRAPKGALDVHRTSAVT